MENLIEQLTHQRLELSSLQQLLKGNFKPLNTVIPEMTDNIFLAHQSTGLAFMWLGKTKGILGGENPYPASSDPSSKVIEAAVDVYQGDIIVLVENPKMDDVVAFVKAMRSELGKVDHAIRHGLMPFLTDRNSKNNLYQLAVGHAWINVCEAKMHLGLLLGQLRDKIAAETPKEEPVETPEPTMTVSSESSTEGPLPQDSNETPNEDIPETGPGTQPGDQIQGAPPVDQGGDASKGKGIIAKTIDKIKGKK